MEKTKIDFYDAQGEFRDCVYKEGSTSIQTTISESTKYCHYNHKPVEYYLEQGFKIYSYTELKPLLEKASEDKYCTGFSEITEDRYWEMLEVLPPLDYSNYKGVKYFTMLEFLTGSITAHYFEFNGKYYTANLKRGAITKHVENLMSYIDSRP